MEETSEKISSSTLERLNASYSTKFPVALFRSKKSGQVLYMEAGKDFVDSLLSFLLLPLGTVIHVLAAGIQVKSALGGVSSILASVQKLSSSDLQVGREHLLRPRPAAIGCSCRSSGVALQRALEDASILPRPSCKPGLSEEFYACILCYNLFRNLNGDYCETCSRNRSRTFSGIPRVAYSVFQKETGPDTIGFVNANTTFIVTDNLEITPLTTNKSVTVLSKLNVDSLADLESNDITVSLTQVLRCNCPCCSQILQLLNSSLTSSNCLTEVFGNLSK